MDAWLGKVLIGGVLVGAVWFWLRYVAWAGIRYQRSAAWLRPALMRRVLRGARRRQRVLDQEIRHFLRRAVSQPTGREGRAGQMPTAARRNPPHHPDTLNRRSGRAGAPGPAHRKPGQPR